MKRLLLFVLFPAMLTGCSREVMLLPPENDFGDVQSLDASRLHEDGGESLRDTSAPDVRLDADAGFDGGSDLDGGMDAGEDSGGAPCRCDMNDKFAKILEDATTEGAELAEDGGFIIVGAKDSKEKGSTNAYWTKLDRLGKVKWTKEVVSPGKSLTASLILAVESGGFAVAGYFRDNNDMYGRAWLNKISETGEIEWSKTYGDIGEISVLSLRKSGDGGLVIAGSNKAGPWMAKLNALGGIQWQGIYRYGGTIRYDSQYLSVDVAKDGSIFAGGSASVEGRLSLPRFERHLRCVGGCRHGNQPRA